MDHPAVLQAVTFAIPHPMLGEDVAAAVVLREGASATEQDLHGFVGQRLAAFKTPRKIVASRRNPQRRNRQVAADRAGAKARAEGERGSERSENDRGCAWEHDGRWLDLSGARKPGASRPSRYELTRPG